MAVFKLVKVTMIIPRSELNSIVVRLCIFGKFHPSDDPELTEFYDLALLKSKAHELYSNINQIISEPKAEEQQQQEAAHPRLETPEPASKEEEEEVVLRAHGLDDLLGKIENEVAVYRGRRAETTLTTDDIRHLEVYKELTLRIFSVLRRIRGRVDLRWFAEIEGYLPENELIRFRERFKDTLLFAERVAKHGAPPYVPTLLKNPRTIKLFEHVTLSLGSPKYSEVDPTPIIAFFFPIFYGMMFSDLGQGLLMFLLGLFLKRRNESNFRYWGSILAVFGVAASVSGFLNGDFFGFALGGPFPLLPVLRPQTFGAESVISLLTLAIIIGTFHLASGYVIALVNRINSRDMFEALLNILPTLLLYSSAIPLSMALIGVGLDPQDILKSKGATPILSDYLGARVPIATVASITIPLVVVSLLVIAFGRAAGALVLPRLGVNPRSSLTEGMVDMIIRPIELLANTLSYTRLGILLIVHLLLMDLLNRAWGIGVAGLPLVVFGNVGVMAIEGLIVYIQDLRLHLYEWFTKFYEGAGVAFTALSLKTNGATIKWI
ncbi:MAG: hypothetical protein M1503_06055 [Thaumarchaeota archaeon]|nr:hypothetical protein [Nitrososphaerota archaeon]MCL5317806.1 hypothetical protein [Nitrososphaerota archaeon]